MKIRWWMITAGIIGGLMLMLGVGNLLDPEDTGPLYGKLALLAVMATGAGLIAYGLVLMRRNEARGAKFVALGVLPGSVGIAFFWFAPAVIVGILAIVTSWIAFTSADRRERSMVA
jgi:hypothetical protein